MRAILGLGLLLIATPAFADNYVLVCSASCTASDGTTQPAGTALARILWDGHTSYTPPAGEAVVPDTRQVLYAPAPPPKPTTITASAFLARFTPAEEAAIWQLAVSNPAIGIGLQTGLAAGQITLTDPATVSWMNGLVGAGAVTAAREAVILAP